MIFQAGPAISRRLFCHRFHLALYFSPRHPSPDSTRLTRSFTSRTTMSSDSVPIEQLNLDVAQQQTLFNDLRAKHAAGSPELEEARKKLSELKMALGKAKGRASASAEVAGGKKKERLLLKTAKVRIFVHIVFTIADESRRAIGHKGLWPRRDVLSRAHRTDCQGMLHNLRRFMPGYPRLRAQGCLDGQVRRGL